MEQGGVHVLEALVIARYFMFTQVYFHQTRRALDILLGRYIQDALKKVARSRRGEYPPPSEPDRFLQLDDSVFFAHAVKEADAGSRNLAWRLLVRDHPRLIAETTPHDPASVTTRLSAILPIVENEFPGTAFYLDRAEDHPEKYRQIDISVRMDGQMPYRSFATSSSVLKGLDQVNIVRLYADTGRDIELRTNTQRRVRVLRDGG